MDLSSGEISTLIFKRAVSDDLGDFSVDQRMLSVFMELDGKTNLGTVARRAGLNMSTMREVVSRLLELKLIAPVEVQEGATIGAGSTITRDAPAGELTLSRAPQETRRGWQRPVKKK